MTDKKETRSEKREKRELMKIIELLEEENRLLVRILIENNVEIPDNLNYIVKKFNDINDLDLPF